MSEQAKKLIIPILTEDNEKTEVSENNPTPGNIVTRQVKESPLPEEREDISGKTSALIEDQGGIESVAGTVVQTVQEDKFLRALQSYFRIKGAYDNAYFRKKK